MISSMTGFGRFEVVKNEKRITAELKSVNHKYLDVNIRLPRSMSAFEPGIKTLLQKYASRGKVDIYISYEDLSGSFRMLKYNAALAAEYLNCYREIADTLSLNENTDAASIARSPDVLVLEEAGIDEEELWPILEETLNEAFSAFKASREKEGESLKNNIMEKLDSVGNCVCFLEERVPAIIDTYKAKLFERVKEFLESGAVDEGRIAAEVTIYADKTAIDEEIVRLKAHIQHMKDVLNKGGAIGRNLDFIAQEMNREANTVLSKSNDLEITDCGIELKTCIEKIREQVQNIE